MGLIFRQSFKASAVSYFGVFLAFVSRLFLFPLLLLPEEIGLLEIVVSISTLAMPIITLGTPKVIVKYRPYFLHAVSYNQFKGAMYIFPLIVFVIASVLSLLLWDFVSKYLNNQDPSGTLLKYSWLIYICTFSFVWSAIQRSISSTFGRISMPDFFKEVLLRIEFFIILILYYFELFSFEVFLVLYILSFLVINLVNEVYNIRLDGFPAMVSRYVVLKLRVLKALNFGLINILTSISSMVVQHIDKIMVGTMVGLSGVGIYSIAFYIGILVELPKRAVARIASPIIASSWKTNDLEKIQSIYHQSANNLMILGTLVLIGIITNIESLFLLIPNGDLYVEGLAVVIFIGLAKWLDLSFGLNVEILSFSKKYPFVLYSLMVLGAVTVLTNLYFIPIFGISGAALASFISISAVNIFRILFLWYTYKLWPFKLKSLGLLAVSIVILFITYNLPSLAHPALNIVIRSLFTLVTFSVSVYFFNFSPELKKYIKKFIMNK